MAARAETEAPRRILITRIRRIGDVILSLPVVDALHERFPDAAIDYLAEIPPGRWKAIRPCVTCWNTRLARGRGYPPRLASSRGFQPRGMTG